MAFIITWVDIPYADRFELTLPKDATIVGVRGPSGTVAPGIKIVADPEAAPPDVRTFFLRATDDPIDVELDHQLVFLGTFRVIGDLHLFEYQATGP